MQDDWAVIFDWDGVVIDSSASHEESWKQLAVEEGRALPADHFERGFGLRGDSIIRNILGWTDDPAEVVRLIARKELLYRAEIRERGLSLLPGVAGFLGALRRAGVACGVGSSTTRGNLECAMDLLELNGTFRAVVSAEDVSKGKPEPDVFLEAARRLGKDPGRCVVVEDAPAGIEAALRGGMLAVGVATTHAPGKLRKAHLVVDRLDALNPDDLRARLGRRSSERA